MYLSGLLSRIVLSSLSYQSISVSLLSSFSLMCISCHLVILALLLMDLLSALCFVSYLIRVITFFPSILSWMTNLPCSCHLSYSSMHMDLALPISAAQCNGVLPFLSSTATFVPCLSSMCMSSALHVSATWCNGVLPLLSSALTFTPCLSSMHTSLALPIVDPCWQWNDNNKESPWAANITPSQQSCWKYWLWFSYTSHGLGQAKPRPSCEWQLWPGLGFEKAKANSSWAKAMAFRPSQAGTTLIPTCHNPIPMG